ncbi:MAG: DUF433 domain-containing protein [Bacteroidia bacterium]|nr:DUF433 domain-containing protein [Bacteroidia bacterium]
MYTHIVSDSTVLNGKPCISGTRMSVDFILELIESGASISDIAQTYPQLSVEAIKEAVSFARHFTENEITIVTKLSA